MADISPLQKTPSFVLDDRSLEQRLQTLKEYCASVPFESAKGRATLADVFFPALGKQPDELAQLYAHTGQADGNMLPHQALLLAFFRMLETPRELLNGLPAKHRQLYYRSLLGLKERPAQADRVVVSFILNQNTSELLLTEGLLLDAGADAAGTPLHYRLEQTLLANAGRLTDVRWCAFSAQRKTTETRIVCDESQAITWPEQGCRLFSFDESQAQQLQIGRVISSEALASKESMHTIKVTFDSQPTVAISAAVSKGSVWQELAEPTVSDGSITWTDDSPKMNEAPNDLDGFTDTAPLFKLYSYADKASVPAVKSVSMHVEKADNVLFSTDEATFDINGRIFPFGTEPGIGMGCYLITPDWFNKPAVKVTLKPEWVDLPTKSFADWYTGYKTPPINNDYFKVDIWLVQNGVRTNLEEGFSLFASGTNSSPEAKPIVFDLSSDEKIAITSNMAKELEDETNPREYPAWIEITLKQDFFHKEYWATLPTLKDGKTAKGEILNLPYTPQWKSLRIDYELIDTKVQTQYVLTPFGHQTADKEDSFKNKAQLYLGFSDIQPDQDIHLHWQLQSPKALAPQWEYLQGDNAWASLDARVRDETQGLFESGLWHAVLPEDASRTASAMPQGRYWIRAVVDDVDRPANQAKIDLINTSYKGSLYPYLYGLHINSATAILENMEGIDPTHFEQALPEKTITQTVQTLEELSEVIQPWPSTGGQPVETEEKFAKRLAQYLSHRQRAVSWRDIKALLQDRFPEICDVRVPKRNGRLDGLSEQTLTLIPVYGKADNSDALKPEFGSAHLARMQAYLQSVSSPWLRLKLSNPTYLEVPVVYQVAFKTGFNAAYGYRELSIALNKRYMRWAWDPDSAPQVGYDLDYYEMLTFIQQQAYVDYVESFTLNGAQASFSCGTTEVLILKIQ